MNGKSFCVSLFSCKKLGSKFIDVNGFQPCWSRWPWVDEVMLSVKNTRYILNIIKVSDPCRCQCIHRLLQNVDPEQFSAFLHDFLWKFYRMNNSFQRVIVPRETSI